LHRSQHWLHLVVCLSFCRLVLELRKSDWVLLYDEAIDETDHRSSRIFRNTTQALGHQHGLLDAEFVCFSGKADPVDVQSQLVLFAILQEVVLCLVVFLFRTGDQRLVYKMQLLTDLNPAKITKVEKLAVIGLGISLLDGSAPQGKVAIRDEDAQFGWTRLLDGTDHADKVSGSDFILFNDLLEEACLDSEELSRVSTLQLVHQVVGIQVVMLWCCTTSIVSSHLPDYMSKCVVCPYLVHWILGIDESQ